MTKTFLFLFTVTLISISTAEHKKIVFFGDSITEMGVSNQGYISQMNQLVESAGLSKEVKLIGRGIGGNKVYDLYLRMQNDVIAEEPDIVVIYIGVNDVWHKQSHGTGTDHNKFLGFYQAIIDTLVAKDIELLLCTPGVIGERTDFSNTLDGDLNHTSSAIKNLAKKNNLKLCDLRGEMLAYNKLHNVDNKEKGILTTDKVHLNEKGNQLVAENLWKILKEML